MNDENYVVDLTTGKKIPAPKEYREGLLMPGETLGPDHIETLRAQGESEDTLAILQSRGNVASYQAGPNAPILLPDDPNFPPLPPLPGESGTEEIRTSGAPSVNGSTRKITSPPDVIVGGFWPFCDKSNPAGYQWFPPSQWGYHDAYYVRGHAGDIYKWVCGYWFYVRLGNHSTRAEWICPGYGYYNNDIQLPPKAKYDVNKLPRYHCY